MNIKLLWYKEVLKQYEKLIEKYTHKKFLIEAKIIRIENGKPYE